MGATVKKGTSLESFWKLLPTGASDALFALPFDGRRGKVQSTVPGIGRIDSYVDEPSEGEDHGGYVKYAVLLDVHDYLGLPVMLEENAEDDSWLFESRMNVLL